MSFSVALEGLLVEEADRPQSELRIVVEALRQTPADVPCADNQGAGAGRARTARPPLAEGEGDATGADERRRKEGEPHSLSGEIVRVASQHEEGDRRRGRERGRQDDRDQGVDHAEVKG